MVLKRFFMVWLLVGVLVGAMASSCATLKPVVLEAQTLPITKTLAWDAPTSGPAPESYVVRLDGTIVATAASTSQAVVFNTKGAHMLSVTSVNIWGESSPATLAVDVNVPGSARNPRIQ